MGYYRKPWSTTIHNTDDKEFGPLPDWLVNIINNTYCRVVTWVCPASDNTKAYNWVKLYLQDNVTDWEVIKLKIDYIDQSFIGWLKWEWILEEKNWAYIYHKPLTLF